MIVSDDIQAVTFGLGAEIFAIPVSYVREILDCRDVFHIPGGPPYLLGLTDLRGEGVTTIDFRLRLGLPATERTPASRVLVVDVPLEDSSLTLGLVVDRVLAVNAFTADQFDPAPDIGVNWKSDYITGVAKGDDTFVVLIDLPAIFSDEDQALLISDDSAD
jgi:purine-binding chemotaxis protein CheW